MNIATDSTVILLHALQAQVAALADLLTLLCVGGMALTTIVYIKLRMKDQ